MKKCTCGLGYCSQFQKVGQVIMCRAGQRICVRGCGDNSEMSPVVDSCNSIRLSSHLPKNRSDSNLMVSFAKGFESLLLSKTQSCSWLVSQSLALISLLLGSLLIISSQLYLSFLRAREGVSFNACM